MSKNYICKICGKKIDEFDHTLYDDKCYDCREKQYKYNLTRALQEDEETETYYEDEVVCPYCGYRMEDDDNYFVREQVGEYKCPECGGTFRFETNIEITYSTQRMEQK